MHMEYFQLSALGVVILLSHLICYIWLIVWQYVILLHKDPGITLLYKMKNMFEEKNTKKIFLWKKIEFRPKSFHQIFFLRKIWIFLISIFEKIFCIFAKTDFYKVKNKSWKKNWKNKFPQKIVFSEKVSSIFFWGKKKVFQANFLKKSNPSSNIFYISYTRGYKKKRRTTKNHVFCW